MRGVRTWALAVRRPHPEQLVDGVLPVNEPALGDIAVAVHPFSSALTRHRLLRLPVLRGVVALGEALRIGFRALRMAADAQSADDAPEIGRGSWLLAGLGGLAIAVGLFFLAPVGLTSLLQDVLGRACCSGSSRASCAPRSSSPTSSSSRGWRTCGASSSTTGPSTRPSPATRRASS